MHAMSLPEQLAHSTIRIECETQAGETAVGTGFFWAVGDRNSSWVPAIVTNRHVVEKAKRGLLGFSLMGGGGKPSYGCLRTIKLDNFADRWIGHPQRLVDLCAAPLSSLVSPEISRGLFIVRLDKSLLPTPAELSSMAALEEIIMVGYPIGLCDGMNNMPIFRRGVTATHPFLDFGGRKEFLIDAACFPGSSGSPVLLYDAGIKLAPDSGLKGGGPTLKMLGVLYAGPQYSVTGTIDVIPIPTKCEQVAISRIPVNLGYVIKAERLLEFEGVFRSRGLLVPQA